MGRAYHECMNITPDQARTPRIAFVICLVLLIGSFFLPPPALAPVDGRTNAAGGTDFRMRLAPGTELVVYALSSHAICLNMGSLGQAVLGSPLRAPAFSGERSYGEQIYHPVGAITGGEVGTSIVISCSTPGQILASSDWLLSGSTVAIVRGGIILLVATFGFYALMSSRRPRQDS